MILYRLTQNHGGLPNGSCITEDKYKQVFYTDKCLFEVINEFEIKDMIEYIDENFCIQKGIEKLLFYSSSELEYFLNQKDDSLVVK